MDKPISKKSRDVLAWFDKFADRARGKAGSKPIGIELPEETDEWPEDWKYRCAELGSYYQEQRGMPFDRAAKLSIEVIRHGARKGLNPFRCREEGKRVNR